MSLYCSKEIFEALDGIHFPVTKDDLIDMAELKDAPEAVIVVLNGLQDDVIYHDISEVCENARVACNYEIVRVLSHAPFPATREQLMEFTDRVHASPTVTLAVEALPSGYTFGNLDEMCEYVL